MSTSTLRYIIISVLIFHGIGHSMGILAAFGVKMSSSSSSNSWLLSNLAGEKVTRIFMILLYASAFLGFICSGLGLAGWLIPAGLWKILVIISSIISLLGMILFWNGLAFLFNKIGAIGVNIAVLISLLWLHWPPEIVD